MTKEELLREIRKMVKEAARAEKQDHRRGLDHWKFWQGKLHAYDEITQLLTRGER